MRKEDSICVDCGIKGVYERKRCRECALLFNRQRAKKRYEKLGRYNYGESVCSVCGEKMILWRKDQLNHSTCRHGDKSVSYAEKQSGRYIARRTLSRMGVKVPKGFDIHHIDENPSNNEITNLLLISRSNHSKLHQFLDRRRSLFLKENSSNSENCWDTLRDSLTTTWLETTGVKVIKIDCIGQSAAELLSPTNKGYEEGSEAMHGESKSD